MTERMFVAKSFEETSVDVKHAFRSEEVAMRPEVFNSITFCTASCN